MSEISEILIDAIKRESGKPRKQVLASVKIVLALQEIQRMGDRFKDNKFQDGLQERIINLLQWISPGCKVSLPALQAGCGNCFIINRDAPGRVLDSLQAEAFAFPSK